MTTRVDSSARVQPTEGKYLAHPGICALCGKAPSHMDEIFANPVIELEQYGYIYFCQPCCAEIGSFVVMTSKETTDALQAVVTGMQNRIDELARENAYMRSLLNVRINLVGRGKLDSDGDVSVPVSETEPESDDINSFIDSLEPDSD